MLKCLYAEVVGENFKTGRQLTRKKLTRILMIVNAHVNFM